MLQELKDKFPNWCKETDSNYSLILSDDIDSLGSCYLQDHLFGRNIEYFMDFNSSYIQDGEEIPCQTIYRTTDKTKNNVIGIDIALNEDGCYTWDNHVSKISNEDDYNSASANLNTIFGVNRFNYYQKKFSGSTLIQMLSYYNVDISEWTEEMKMILCCIDGLYTAFDVWKKDFRPLQRKYLQLLEYDELIELMEYHCNKNKKKDFEELKQKYKLDSKIVLNSGTHKLETDIKLNEISELFGINLNLPDTKFDKFKEYDKHIHYDYIPNKKSLCSNDTKALFNLALVKKDMVIYSTNKIITQN